MVPYLEMLMEYYRRASKHMNKYDLLEITEALAELTSGIPFNQVLKVLQEFCLPIASEIHGLANGNTLALQSETSSETAKIQGKHLRAHYIWPKNLFHFKLKIFFVYLELQIFWIE